MSPLAKNGTNNWKSVCVKQVEEVSCLVAESIRDGRPPAEIGLTRTLDGNLQDRNQMDFEILLIRLLKIEEKTIDGKWVYCG